MPIKSSEKIFAQKAEFRKKMKGVLNAIPKEKKALESAAKCLSFIQSEAFKNAKIIFAFMPLKDEVDVLPILRTALQKGKKVLIPKIAGKKIEFYFVKSDPTKESARGAFGIFEPAPFCKKAAVQKICEEHLAKEIVVLVPGLAFTKKGVRLGRGRGYYDEFLSEMKKFFAAKNAAAGENAAEKDAGEKKAGVQNGGENGLGENTAAGEKNAAKEENAAVQNAAAGEKARSFECRGKCENAAAKNAGERALGENAAAQNAGENADRGSRPIFVGVCYNAQIAEELPCGTHDEKVDFVA